MYRLTILSICRSPLITPLDNSPWYSPWYLPLITPLVPEPLSLTWNPSFLCGAILVHPGPRLLVNWPSPPHSLPIPFSHPQRFPNPIMRPSTTTSRHRLQLVRHNTSKGIVQRILRGVKNKLKKSVLANWRTTRLSFWILKGHHHKRSRKPFSAA